MIVALIMAGISTLKHVSSGPCKFAVAGPFLFFQWQ